MPVPAFGFSFGDCVTAIELIRKISKALRETGGAADEFHLVLQDLHNLQQILEVLQTLRPAGASTSHVNAIRGTSLGCLIPLREFSAKLEERFGPALHVGSTKSPFARFGRKAQWATLTSEEVFRFRIAIITEIISISLLLGILAR